MVGMVAHYVGVKTETVEFYSEGARLRGFLHRPDAAADRLITRRSPTRASPF